MKNIFLSVVLTLTGAIYCNAQAFAGSVGMSAGWVEDGYGANFSYNHHFNRMSYLQFGFFGGFSEDTVNEERIPYNIIAFQPAYFRKVVGTSGFKPINLYAGIGGLLGYEIINNGSESLPSGALIEAQSTFLYGGYLGLEVEYAIQETFSVGVKYNQHYQPSSDIGSFYPFVGLSLRYYLF